MAEENVAVNDNTNEPQPEVTPADPAETMLGGNGTTAEQTPQETPAGAPEQYDFKATIPEGVDMDEAITKEYSEIARSMNMTNEQANQVAAFGIKYAQQVADTVRSQYNAEVKAWGEAAKAEMGADFEKTMTTAGAGIEAAEKVIPGVRKMLNETGAGNRIEMIRLCEMLGQLVQADPGKMVNAGGNMEQAKPQTWYPNSKM